MRKLLCVPIFAIVGILASCGGKSTSSALTQEQMDSIAKVKEDSTRVADSIQAVEKAKNDSIILAKKKANEERIAKLAKNFRVSGDEFTESQWIYNNVTPKYTNRNSIHLYFQMKGKQATNLRFRVQYESDDWLFIRKMIFNVDGENITFIPEKMDTDCGNGGRIWEWCDESASYNQTLVSKIAKAKVVKIKFDGRQYYDKKTMSSKELNAFKETFEYYRLLGGSL